MLKPEMEKGLNKQLNWEQTAAQDYLAMSAYFAERNLAGFANFMRSQADEERVHAMKIYDYVLERGGSVRLSDIAAPNASYDSALAVFRAAYDREKSNTASIHELYKLAVDLNDYPAQVLLHWFIDEQVEEEAWCDEAVALLDMAGNDSATLLQLDQRYGDKAASGKA